MAKAHFHPPPLRTEDIDGTEAILLESLKFFSAKLNRVVVAPAGFRTDFASIPRGLWNLFPKRGLHDRAAVLHDAAYRGKLRNSLGYTLIVTKQVADDLFEEALATLEIPRLRRYALVQAVRWFGRPKVSPPR
jgi:hypothetical protein